MYKCNLLTDKQKQFGSFRHSFFVFNFCATETTIIGPRTQDTFSGFWPFCVIFIVLRIKNAEFGTNRFIRCWSVSKHTYPQFQFYIYEETFQIWVQTCTSISSIEQKNRNLSCVQEKTSRIQLKIIAFPHNAACRHELCSLNRAWARINHGLSLCVSLCGCFIWFL